jgi:hypothetical protein
LSGCFASISASVIELGAGNADEESVLSALEQQALLKHNAHLFARSANILNLCGTLLSFLSTASAVVSTYIIVKASDGSDWAEEYEKTVWWHILNVMTTFLPSLAGLLITLLSRLRYVEKWAQTHVASVEIESEIYAFRTRAVDYDFAQYAIAVELANQAKSKRRGNKQMGKKMTGDSGEQSRLRRELFANRVSTIFTQALAGALKGDALDNTNAMSLVHAAREKNMGAKQGHNGSSYTPLLDFEEEVDDLVKPLSSEAYYEHRLQKSLKHFSALAPRLASKVRMYEILIFVTSVCGTLLGACRQIVWVPFAMSAGLILASYLQYESLQARLTAANAAISEISSAQTQWRSLGVVEKQMRSTRNFLVSVVEGAILREAGAYASGAQAASKNVRSQQVSQQDEKMELEKSG